VAVQQRAAQAPQASPPTKQLHWLPTQSEA
jgi:hypothetical protein